MPILVVGSVAYDSVKTPFGHRERALGGSATYFSVSASFFTGVRLVGVVGEDFDSESRRVLTDRNVDLSGLQQVPGRTFHWTGEYGYDLNTARTLDTQLNVFAGFRPVLPPGWEASEYVFLGNIDPVLQQEVLAQASKPKLVACDTMNFWIDVKREALLETLSRVDIVLINDAEARQLSGEGNLIRAAARIHDMGPRTVVVKRGEYGALMFHRSSVFAAPAFPLEQPIDPTGAGDSFAGGFMGCLARTGNLGEDGLRQAIVCGSVMASFNVEDFSLDRLKRLTEREIRERYAAFAALTRFTDVPVHD